MNRHLKFYGARCIEKKTVSGKKCFDIECRHKHRFTTENIYQTPFCAACELMKDEISLLASVMANGIEFVDMDEFGILKYCCSQDHHIEVYDTNIPEKCRECSDASINKPLTRAQKKIQAEKNEKARIASIKEDQKLFDHQMRQKYKNPFLEMTNKEFKECIELRERGLGRGSNLWEKYNFYLLRKYGNTEESDSYEDAIKELILNSADELTASKLLSNFIDNSEKKYGLNWMKKITSPERKLYNELTDITLGRSLDIRVQEKITKLKSVQGPFWFLHLTTTQKKEFQEMEKTPATFLEQALPDIEEEYPTSPKWKSVWGDDDEWDDECAEDDIQKAIKRSLETHEGDTPHSPIDRPEEPFTNVPDFDIDPNPQEFKKSVKLSQRSNNI